jgi:hypothetical protein
VPYSDSGGGFWGEDVCLDALLTDTPGLASDAEFQDRFDSLFSDASNWNEAEAAYFALESYLELEYGIDIDDYFDWEDWRVEHENS